MSYGYGIITYQHCTLASKLEKSQHANMAFRVLLAGRSHVHVQHVAQKYMNRSQHEWQSIRSFATEIIVVGHLALKGMCNKTEI